MNKLYRFYWDCGRAGNVEGLFIASEKEIEDSLGKQVYFGEILGKHSDIYGELEKEDVKQVDVSQTTVDEIKEILGDTLSGYNPLWYLKHQCSMCEDSYHADELNSKTGICYMCDDEEYCE